MFLWKIFHKFPDVAKLDDEILFSILPQNCLSLDIFTSNVVYEELQPVVVYIGGSDLKEHQGGWCLYNYQIW